MSLEKKEKSKTELMNLKSLYDEFNFVVKRDEVDMLEELKAKYGKDTFNDIVIFQPFIFKACAKGSKQVVKWALDRYGSQVNIPDQFGNQPIHHAIHSKCAETVGVLITYGADVNTKDSSGLTPLYLASASNGHSSCLTALLDAGANLLIQNDGSLRTALFSTIERDGVKVARMLLIAARQRGVLRQFLEAKNCFGQTAYEYALEWPGGGRKNTLHLLKDFLVKAGMQIPLSMREKALVERKEKVEIQRQLLCTNLLQNLDKFPETVATCQIAPPSESGPLDLLKGLLSKLTGPEMSDPNRKRKEPESALGIALHELTTLNMFMTIPSFALSVLQERQRAINLLNLALGICQEIPWNSADASFEAMLDSHPLDSDAGRDLRKRALDNGVMNYIVACLAIFAHEVNSVTIAVPSLDAQFVLSAESRIVSQSHQHLRNDFWEKGTGYGTGRLNQAMNVNEEIRKQRAQEEDYSARLFRTLSAWILPSSSSIAGSTDSSLLSDLLQLIKSSQLIPVVKTYLSNDAVMDLSQHSPIYSAIFQLLRSLASSPPLIEILSVKTSESESSICSLLGKLRDSINRYTALMRNPPSRSAALGENSPSILLENLCRDALSTWDVVKAAVGTVSNGNGEEGSSELDSLAETSGSALNPVAPEEAYCTVMKPIQVDSFPIIVESDPADNSMNSGRFAVSFRFEKDVVKAGDVTTPNRMRRLATEIATLSSSLPLSSSSSIFVRYDVDRPDIMKVLITGPADTPYSGGCFEFDVYFPSNYPTLPMKVHLVTTGHKTVRFNPNLYANGKVCLSLLGTFAGRPDEKWNPTSTLLQVLVSIQSLILVPEPYFNEPGFERSRGTMAGDQKSRDYNMDIRLATVKWAMLEQLKNPSPCFNEVISSHFRMNRKVIETKCKEWINEMESEVQRNPSGSQVISDELILLKNYFSQLEAELARLFPSSSGMSNENLGKDGEQDDNGGTPQSKKPKH